MTPFRHHKHQTTMRKYVYELCLQGIAGCRMAGHATGQSTTCERGGQGHTVSRQSGLRMDSPVAALLLRSRRGTLSSFA